MTGNKPRLYGVPFGPLFNEINRIRKRDGLDEMGALHFYLKIHDHVLVEPNPRVSEALENLRPKKELRASA
jgi:hypothetical protein